MKILLNSTFTTILAVVLVLSILGIVIAGNSLGLFASTFLISYLLLAFTLSLKIDKVLHKV